MAAAFPTVVDGVTGVTYKPSVKHLRYTAAHDHTLRTKLNSGRKVTYSETPNTPYVIEFMFASIPTANKDALLTWESGTVYWNTLPFTWTDETDSVQRTLMLVSPITASYTDEDAGRWDVLFRAEETIDNYS